MAVYQIYRKHRGVVKHTGTKHTAQVVRLAATNTRKKKHYFGRNPDILVLYGYSTQSSLQSTAAAVL